LSVAVAAFTAFSFELREEEPHTPALPGLPFAAAGQEAPHAAVLWQTTAENLSVTLKAAHSPHGLFLQCDIKGDVLDNPYRERDLWRGDCVHVSIDMRGDTVADALEQGAFQPDDAVYIAGIGSAGPELRCSEHGNKARQGADASAFIRAFAHDKDRQLTSYSLVIPWDELSSGIGQSDGLGLAVTVAHKTTNGVDTVWGQMRAQAGLPKQFNRFALLPAGQPYCSIAPVQRMVLSPDETATLVVAVNQPASGTVHAVFGATNVTHAFARGRRRFVIEIPGRHVAYGTHDVRVDVAAGAAACGRTIALSTPAVAAGTLSARIAGLLAATTHPWARRHLESVELIVKNHLNNLALQPDMAASFITVTEYIAGKLPETGFDFDTQVSHGLPFVCAFISDADHSLQMYMLQFPYGYDAGTSYPLTVYLHGAGSDYPMDGLRTYFDNTGQDTLFTYDPIDPAQIPAPQRGFVIAPWARGNSFYRGMAELDVLQAIRETQDRFAIDKNRLYLAGFSMGSYGAWRLASMTPGMWAGVNLASGFWAAELLEHRIANVRGLPFVLQAGSEEPPFAEGCKLFFERFRQAGLDATLHIIKDMRHTYPHPLFCKNIAALMRHTRTLPAAFSFVAESHVHRGRNGITMNLPYTGIHGDLPRFSCKIEGATVFIDSQGTEGLHVDLGSNGLGLTGRVEVVWNGASAYQGPAEGVFLGKEF